MFAYQSGNKSVQTNSFLVREKSAIGWLPKVIAVLGALLLIAGALIALFHPVMLVSAHDEINGAVHIYAAYLASRNLALAVMLFAALGLGAKRLLNNLLLLVSLIQLLDAVIDVVEGRGPLPPESWFLRCFSSSHLVLYPVIRSGRSTLGKRAISKNDRTTGITVLLVPSKQLGETLWMLPVR